MSEPANPVLLTEVPTEADAILLCNALAEHGVRTVYNGTAIAGFRAEAPAMVRVLVAADELDRANALIAEHGLDAGSEVDWSQVDVGEADSREPSEPSETLSKPSWIRRYAAFEVLVVVVTLLALAIF